MVQIPFELSKIYVTNLKEKELNKMLLKEEEVLPNIILNHKIDRGPLRPMPIEVEVPTENLMMFPNLILKLLI